MAMGHGEFVLDVSSIVRACENAFDRLDRSLRRALADCADAVADSAKRDHGYQDRSGNLTESIRSEQVTGGTQLSVEVSANMPYAAAIELGAKPHKITAKPGGFLRFGTAGGLRFAKSVNHPGNKPFKFLEEALDREQDDIAVFMENGLADGFDEAGFEVHL